VHKVLAVVFTFLSISLLVMGVVEREREVE
jgi:hypothetical protein